MWRWHEAGAGPGPGTWEIWTEPLCNLFVVFILLVVVLVFQSVLLMSKLCDKLLTHFSEGTLVHTNQCRKAFRDPFFLHILGLTVNYYLSDNVKSSCTVAPSAVVM